MLPLHAHVELDQADKCFVEDNRTIANKLAREEQRGEEEAESIETQRIHEDATLPVHPLATVRGML
jgi:hypothetical protein